MHPPDDMADGGLDILDVHNDDLLSTMLEPSEDPEIQLLLSDLPAEDGEPALLHLLARALAFSSLMRQPGPQDQSRSARE